MQIIHQTPEKMTLRMNANYSLANAIRRSVDEIPVLAVDEVEMFKNDSALYDEFLSHRIGLVPLKTEKKMNEKTRVELKLVKKGPGIVYSGDMKGSADLVHDKIPLTLLEEGQEVELVATAQLGKGVDHAKYIPGLCYYRPLLEVKSSKSEVEKIVNSSNGAIKPEKKGGSWICDLNDVEIEEINKHDKEAIKDADEILMFIESFGQIEAKDILTGAVEALTNNLTEFENSLP